MPCGTPVQYELSLRKTMSPPAGTIPPTSRSVIWYPIFWTSRAALVIMVYCWYICTLAAAKIFPLSSKHAANFCVSQYCPKDRKSFKYLLLWIRLTFCVWGRSCGNWWAILKRAGCAPRHPVPPTGGGWHVRACRAALQYHWQGCARGPRAEHQERLQGALYKVPGKLSLKHLHASPQVHWNCFFQTVSVTLFIRLVKFVPIF